MLVSTQASNKSHLFGDAQIVELGIPFQAELLDLCAPAAVDVLAHLRRNQTYEPREVPPLYSRFITIYRNQVRQLLKWGLVHRDRLVAMLRNGSPDRLAVSVVEELVSVGIEHTAGLLRGYLLDPDLGPAAVRAIRAIEGSAW